MSFDVAALAYDRFMGPFSTQLASQMADIGDLAPDEHALDVGCGTGALTRELVRRLGPSHVAAVDPSAGFADAVRERYPGVEVAVAAAESLPFPTASFDAALAQLVVHFMTEPVRGIAEMARVVRRGGTVAACVWDHAGGTSPLARFWDAARELDPDVVDESSLPGVREGHLEELFTAAGLADVSGTTLGVEVSYPTFAAWWDPLLAGVGPAGALVARLDEQRREALRERCQALYGPGPLTVTGRAWAARGVATGSRPASRARP